MTPLSALAMKTIAREALLVDFSTGNVLFEKNADTLMPPASMSKIMTTYIAFNRLKSGQIKLEDKIHISEKAWRKGGSKMFVKVNSQVTLKDILRGIIVQSGNDAAIALAEFLEGSEEAFADVMTQKALELGMKESQFRNSTGWPHKEHLVTARDLAQLTLATIKNFPDLYAFYAEKSFTYNKIRQSNRNPLLYNMRGADGLKTGYTRAAGYGLTASVKRGKRRLILVINGLKSARDRSREAQRILEWGFRNFDNYLLFKKGQTVAKGAVWLGEYAKIPMTLQTDLMLTLKRSVRNNLKVSIKYNEPIPAPIEKGTKIGLLVIKGASVSEIESPLLAGISVKRLSAVKRIPAAIRYLIWGPEE